MTQVKDLHRKWMKNPKYKSEYDKLAPEMENCMDNVSLALLKLIRGCGKSNLAFHWALDTIFKDGGKIDYLRCSPEFAFNMWATFALREGRELPPYFIQPTYFMGVSNGRKSQQD